MFLPSPEDIKKRRIELALTQKDLAARAGVSQPLIARIESGDVDPRLSTLQKIFSAFDAVRREKVLIRDIMHAPVIHTTSLDSVEAAVKVMEQNGFSQLPVIDDGVPVGSISTDNIVRSMGERDVKHLSHLQVKTIMGEPFPSVAPTTDANTVSSIMEHNPAVLVIEKGKVSGVVTKHDIMRLLH